MNEGAIAALFYASVAALVAGAIRSVRAAVERKGRDRAGMFLAIGGVVGLAAAVVSFNIGPKIALPF